ncbi:hypothetical protein [Thioalkalivibrio thiocyanodenitrificans]|uniref:hypothetical protein n=1 Tax=Thioalkalivibrio thiocyanodenitrificans TaxID=243063 RepID=UPI0012EA0474|nr:hypothetical protein [Thioalkalivibrio thiocyanodenitrificans]
MKLREDRDTLDIAEAIAKIAAAVLVPVVIAYFGWSYQAQLSETGRQIELVRMAVDVLKDLGPTSSELELWAKEVLEQESLTKARLRKIEAEAQQYSWSAFCIDSDHPLLERPGPLPRLEGETWRDVAVYAVTLKNELEMSHILRNATLDWIENAQKIQCSINGK